MKYTRGDNKMAILELIMALGLAGIGISIILYVFYKKGQELDRYNTIINYLRDKK